MQIVPATLYERNVFKINIWKKICFQSIKLNETNVSDTLGVNIIF